jgi:hypothetical protein
MKIIEEANENIDSRMSKDSTIFGIERGDTSKDVRYRN